MEKRHTRFASDEERLAAIERTVQEAAPPEAIDMQSVVSQAVDAYWSEREAATRQSSAPAWIAGLSQETAKLAHQVAANIPNPRWGFVYLAFFAILTTLFTRDSQLIALEKRCDPANKGSSAHSFTVPEPEMLNICPNWNLLI